MVSHKAERCFSEYMDKKQIFRRSGLNNFVHCYSEVSKLIILLCENKVRKVASIK